MSILDQLLETKDLLAYIDNRIENLKFEKMKYVSTSRCTSQSGAIHQINTEHRFDGRIWELEILRHYVKTNQVKEQSKNNWKNVNR